MPDVNVLVAAHRSDAAHHGPARAWLEAAMGSDRREQVGLSVAVLTGYVRVVTHRRLFHEPTPLDTALLDIDRLRDAVASVSVTPGQHFWSIFVDLCRDGAAHGNLTADAAHAATAIEAGATWVTYDRDFSRFPGLSCRML